LLHRKTCYNFKLAPQDGVLQLQNVYAENLEPTDENIRSDCRSTRLYRAPVPLSYGKPGLSRKEKTKEKFKVFTALGKSKLHKKLDSQEWLPFEDNWDKLEEFFKISGLSTRQLHFHANVDIGGNGLVTQRGLVQNKKSMNFVTELYPPGKSIFYENDSGRDAMNFVDVDGFPVDRLDPPHSDVIIPAGRSTAQADYWRMEYEFRKICIRPSENGHVREHYFMPKNLIAYFVQRIMQFKPETFGRFRISDGSHTYIMIDVDGTPRVLTIGETSQWVKEYDGQPSYSENDIGLDVPVGDEYSSVTLGQNVTQILNVDDNDFDSINSCVEQPSDVPSQGGFYSDLVGEGYFDDMDYEDYLEEQDCLDEAELIY